ncbi:hypothetical protein [Cystobacter ferrugineus]|uniref:DUF4189 domain-containing protein n=1 Tax=Cystobacter ferrugineus TaxID=83449 RepID=A0A1L9AU68_9BACT|nr:hypothetical protein [Cystobacter ferrugineus]OJH33524.1 hypothetical protein BON30_48210 [Cystobacter ferrugineus]
MKKPPQSRSSVRHAIKGSLCVLVLSAASPSAAQEFNSCGKLESRVFHITARGLACEEAKEVAQAYDDMLNDKSSFPSTKVPMEVRGFSCRSRSVGYESYKVRCTKGRQVIEFDWGV